MIDTVTSAPDVIVGVATDDRVGTDTGALIRSVAASMAAESMKLA